MKYHELIIWSFRGSNSFESGSGQAAQRSSAPLRAGALCMQICVKFEPIKKGLGAGFLMTTQTIQSLLILKVVPSKLREV